jgi:small-conductance mechanosensitive channel
MEKVARYTALWKKKHHFLLGLSDNDGCFVFVVVVVIIIIIIIIIIIMFHSPLCDSFFVCKKHGLFSPINVGRGLRLAPMMMMMMMIVFFAIFEQDRYPSCCFY